MKIQFPSGFAIFLAGEEAALVEVQGSVVSIISSTGGKKTVKVPKYLLTEKQYEGSSKKGSQVSITR